METARRNARLIGDRLSEAGIQPVADFAGIGKSTVHSWGSENRDALGRMLAFLGLKVVPVNMRCYDPEEVAALFAFAKKHMHRMQSADDLSFDEDPE